ncbi:PAS domain S-box protein, partial [Vibrio parahaemolyticus]
ERRAAQEALRRTEEQFRLLVQGVTDYAIYMLDPDGMVSSWNAGAERIKGYRPEEIVGHHFERFYTPEDRERGEPQRSLDIVRREGRV